ncbi:hypothetical protein IRJ41_007344 [Triplophysa rosa]|uniref:Uncharacterized protein n=1 Tax=Triplophysa rosa TaxID=992332 RepID=A0A9W7TEG1_TRIRA|nr:hypothetical protein IRJ41_007344 [Triplophysa rosa]
MNVTESEKRESGTQRDFGNICTPSGVSVQCVDNQEGQDGQIMFDLLSYRMQIPDDTFEENNTPLQCTTQLSIQCMENQEGLQGQIMFEDVSYPMNLQPLDDPDIDDEGIEMNMEEI